MEYVNVTLTKCWWKCWQLECKGSTCDVKLYSTWIYVLWGQSISSQFWVTLIESSWAHQWGLLCQHQNGLQMSTCTAEGLDNSGMCWSYCKEPGTWSMIHELLNGEVKWRDFELLRGEMPKHSPGGNGKVGREEEWKKEAFTLRVLSPDKGGRSHYSHSPWQGHDHSNCRKLGALSQCNCPGSGKILCCFYLTNPAIILSLSLKNQNEIGHIGTNWNTEQWTRAAWAIIV